MAISFVSFVTDSHLLHLQAYSSTMVDHQIVCCMCGDVGFPDKLFRCNKCSNRFQHSYCSNYCNESGICDWCLSKEKTGKSTKKPIGIGGSNRSSEYSHEKVKHGERDEIMVEKGKNNTNTSGVPSPRQASRRYKSLKDVMC